MVNVTTLAEIIGLVTLIGGGFLLGVREGIIAVGVALLYEARS